VNQAVAVEALAKSLLRRLTPLAVTERTMSVMPLPVTVAWSNAMNRSCLLAIYNRSSVIPSV
jgi:hypothetical protein